MFLVNTASLLALFLSPSAAPQKEKWRPLMAEAELYDGMFVQPCVCTAQKAWPAWQARFALLAS